MSRCFPFRPTRHVMMNGVGGGGGGEALIESIKTGKEHSKAEPRKENSREKHSKAEPTKEKSREKHSKAEPRKEKSREKNPKTDPRKGKSGERKDKRKEREEEKNLSADKSKRLKTDKSYQKEKSRDLFKGCLAKPATKGGKVEERLENSDVTEEHDEPVSTQSVCYMSDGTQGSNKTKSSTTPSGGITVNRNILRIRLPSLKQREPKASTPQVKQPCSTSGRAAGSCAVQKEVFHLPQQQQTLEQPCSTSGRAADSFAEKKEVFHLPQQLQSSVTDNIINGSNIDGKLAPIIDSIRKENTTQLSGAQTSLKNTTLVQKKESPSPYKALFEDWVPIPLQRELLNESDDNDDWLFKSKSKQQGLESQRVKVKANNDGTSCSQSYTSWPRAQYLPEADIYALPYTIPF